MSVHHLKTWPAYFVDVVSGRKQFEIRHDDRGFKVGDDLVLEEWCPSSGYTGRSVEKSVGYMTYFEQKPGFVVLGFKP